MALSAASTVRSSVKRWPGSRRRASGWPSAWREPRSSERDEAGHGGERHAQRPAVALGAAELGVVGLDQHVLIGLDAGDLEREDVRRFAGQQGGLPALVAGGLVGLLGLPALGELGRDLDLAEADADAGHGGIAGQREAVDGLDRLAGSPRR